MDFERGKDTKEALKIGAQVTAIKVVGVALLTPRAGFTRLTKSACHEFFESLKNPHIIFGTYYIMDEMTKKKRKLKAFAGRIIEYEGTYYHVPHFRS